MYKRPNSSESDSSVPQLLYLHQPSFHRDLRFTLLLDIHRLHDTLPADQVFGGSGQFVVYDGYKLYQMEGIAQNAISF